MAERDFRRCWGTPAALHRGRALHGGRSATFLGFGAREGFMVKSWYQDVQTGAGKDALLLRP